MLNGNVLITVLIVEFAIIAGVYAYNHDWPRLVYWLGAVMVNIGILKMK